MNILCLILARGGSKRIPDKNIRLLGGKPLISYTIECAKKSKYINRIIVSTDSDKIAEISIKAGAEAPFRRPSEISKENSTELEAFKHALNWLKENENYVPDLIVKLFSTSPFRKAESVDKAIELLLGDPRADSVRSVRLCSEHPHKMWKIAKNRNRLESFVPKESKLPEAHTLSYHLLPEAYIQNASIDVIRVSMLFSKNSIIGTEIIPLVMDEIESIDINMPLDFTLAETVLKLDMSPESEPSVKHNEPFIPEDLEAYKDYLRYYQDCIICGCKEYKLWASYGSYKAVRCAKCGFVWMNPALTEDGLKKYYQDYIGMRFKDEVKTKQRQVQYQIDKNFLEAYITHGKVLDVGCSGGFFLSALCDDFEKYGIEMDAEAVKYARDNYSFGRNINDTRLEDSPFPDEYFDLIIMRGVIEHLLDPKGALKHVSRLLKKGGYFFIAATPNADSFCADLYRMKWNQFHPVRHLYYFSPATLSKLCASFDLKLIAKDFPYPDTPYADIENDHLEVLRALELKKINQFDKVKRSRAFWGNMMNLIYKKA